MPLAPAPAIRSCYAGISTFGAVSYRYAGVRLAELAWSAEIVLPRLEAEAPGQWTLYVCGKGRKAPAIPLPTPCVAVLRAYRHARGLAAEPPAHEALPVIHGNKGEALQSAGRYRAVKAIFVAVADGLHAREPAHALLLRSASPHWLRHAYARWWSTTKCRCQPPRRCSGTPRCRLRRPMPRPT